MKNKKKLKKNNNMLLVYILLIAIVFMVAGYAVLSQNISITGTATSDTTFALDFSNATITDSSGLTGGTPTLSGGDTILTINPAFEKPGSFVEVTVDITNNGSIPAKITGIVPTNPIGAGITWSVTPEFALDQVLQPAAYTTVVIRVEYPIGSTVQGPQSETFGVVVTYSQET